MNKAEESLGHFTSGNSCTQSILMTFVVSTISRMRKMLQDWSPVLKLVSLSEVKYAELYLVQ